MNSDDQASVGRVETRSLRLALPPGGFRLQSGAILPEITVAYETYGTLRPERDNAVFICHALSGDAHAAGYHDPDRREATTGWWDSLIGPGKGIDTRHYYVICANILGGCKGTTGPSSMNPGTGRPYGSQFPAITVGDIVAVHAALVRQLGIERLAAIVGGSFGGLQVLEWAIAYPEMIRHAVCIASAASLSAQALAFDIVGRTAILHDPNWQGGDYYETGRGPVQGLSLARKIGHITYLSREMMEAKFGRERRNDRTEPAEDPRYGFRSNFQIESYLDHQGRKFVERFDANSYLHITRAMDEYDLAERHGSLERAFAAVQAKMLIVAISSDWLFPESQSLEIAHAFLRAGKRVSYCRLEAPHGHDGFLVEVDHLAEVLRAFLPWVGGAATPRAASALGGRPRRLRLGISTAYEHDVVADRIRPGSRVLDLGCGRGELLSRLVERRGVYGLGIDMDLDSVIAGLDRGHDVFQADMDAGLSMIPDGAYDYAILSETLQLVRHPRLVLHEMLRVAREGIVTFPNFGHWCHRVRLAVRGRMPMEPVLPFEWYDSPNIHLFTLRDFVELCRRDRIRILEVVGLARRPLSRFLIGLRCLNAGAERVLVRIAGPGGGTGGRAQTFGPSVESRSPSGGPPGDGKPSGGKVGRA